MSQKSRTRWNGCLWFVPLAGLGLLLSPGRAAADQVIPDDLIVQGSICVGFDCVNNESFGFDTIRLKENNTRIKFEDTSAGAFPSTDWELTANDSSSGGVNRFSIRDVDAARDIFTVRAGAPANSIFVDSSGRVGFRTSTPVLDLHVSTSNSPGMRLEQNSSGGFTAQTWDIAGNEANFFVRDVTNGSKLPFRLRPGAPTSSIDVAASGNVGFGTASPSEKLHVVDTNNATSGRMLIEDNGTGASNKPGLLLKSGNTNPVNSNWAFEVNGAGDFQIDFQPSAGPELNIIDTTGDVLIFHNLSVTGNVTKGGGSFKIDHPLDPENKYLSHSFVESPDMMNIYNGNAVLDENGEVTVELPEWFDALNRDYRYQLTAMGGPAPNIHVAQELAKNQFKIAGGPKNGKVSWQVTGVRQDAFAKTHPIILEENKATEDRGSYLHPDAYGLPPDRGLHQNQAGKNVNRSTAAVAR